MARQKKNALASSVAATSSKKKGKEAAPALALVSTEQAEQDAAVQAHVDDESEAVNALLDAPLVQVASGTITAEDAAADLFDEGTGDDEHHLLQDGARLGRLAIGGLDQGPAIQHTDGTIESGPHIPTSPGPAPTTTDPGSSMTQAEIEAKAAAATVKKASTKPVKATTAHAFRILGAYAGAKGAGGDVEKAILSVLEDLPVDIRRKACAIAISKEMPKSPVVLLLQKIHDKQPASTSTGGGSPAARGTAKRRKIVTVRDGKGHGLWINATDEMIKAGVVDVVISADGSVSVNLPKKDAPAPADDSGEGEAVVPAGDGFDVLANAIADAADDAAASEA